MRKKPSEQQPSQERRWIRSILRHGNQVAAEQLIRTYYDDVYSYLCRQVRNKEDALDLTQESFIAALQSLPSFDAEKAGFRTWIYRIATNKVIDAHRRRGSEPLSYEELADEGSLPSGDPAIAEQDFVSQLADAQLLLQIEERIRTMDAKVQEVYRLRLYGEYSFPDIATITGQPEPAVKARYYRLLHTLRKEFQDYV